MPKAKTTTATFKSPAAKLHEFVADINNLPKWATNFCLSVTVNGDDHMVKTPNGDLYFRIDADGRTGIADMWGGPSKEQMMRWPVRVVDDNNGGSVLVFTSIQMPGQSSAEFEAQCAALEEEFEHVRRHIDG